MSTLMTAPRPIASLEPLTATEKEEEALFLDWLFIEFEEAMLDGLFSAPFFVAPFDTPLESLVNA